MNRHQESKPALISVNFSFLLGLSKVKYHWLKNGKVLTNIIKDQIAEERSLGIKCVPTRHQLSRFFFGKTLS